MAEPEKDQIGDGQDNFGQAAGKAIQAAKQISHDAAAEAAVKGAEASPTPITGRYRVSLPKAIGG